MKGTEKQVSWAEDIRKGFAGVVDLLSEAESILANTEQQTMTYKDSLGRGSVERKTYTHTLRPEHEAAISKARHWHTEDQIQYLARRGRELAGTEHADRISIQEFFAKTLANLKTALDTEDEAKYWIDRR